MVALKNVEAVAPCQEQFRQILRGVRDGAWLEHHTGRQRDLLPGE
jgi:hypothetical protein